MISSAVSFKACAHANHGKGAERVCWVSHSLIRFEVFLPFLSVVTWGGGGLLSVRLGRGCVLV